MKIRIERTNSENSDFIKLVNKLNAYLKIMDGDEHQFYMQFNNIDTLKNVVVIYANNTPAACGAFRSYNDDTTEIKRMYVSNEFRRMGLAQKVLAELENWSKELGYTNCMLETGKRMTNAVAFYVKNGYESTPNYGQYKHKGDSVCFEKQL